MLKYRSYQFQPLEVIIGPIKMFPVLIQFLTKMIDLFSLPNETAEAISKHLKTCLKQYNIIEKCVAFPADNFNTNFEILKRSGKSNACSHLKMKFGKDLIGMDCPDHIVHHFNVIKNFIPKENVMISLFDG